MSTPSPASQIVKKSWSRMAVQPDWRMRWLGSSLTPCGGRQARKDPSVRTASAPDRTVPGRRRRRCDGAAGLQGQEAGVAQPDALLRGGEWAMGRMGRAVRAGR